MWVLICYPSSPLRRVRCLAFTLQDFLSAPSLPPPLGRGWPTSGFCLGSWSEAIRDTRLGRLLARLRDLHLAASSRCRLAVTRLLLLQTTEAWNHHTLSLSLQAQDCSCLPALSQLSGTRTPADSSESSFHRTAVV